MRPIKSEMDRWQEMRELGKLGEKIIELYLKNQGYTVVTINPYPDWDKFVKDVDWREIEKLPKVPDGIARKNNEIFFYDVKTKHKYPRSEFLFVVNVRDYDDHYIRYAQVLPVRVYFLFINYNKKMVALFVHKVEKRDYPIEIMWDKNKVYNLKYFVEQLE